MSDYLPRDVLIDILKRLPPKSLLKCTRVCKSWYFLITDPNFISIHLHHHHHHQSINQTDRTSNKLLLLVRHYDMFEKSGRYALHFHDSNFNEFMELNCPFSSENEYFRIVGTCNGLVCFSDDFDCHTDAVYLWNPVIRKSVTLPKPQFEFMPHGLCQLGFGFDSVRDEYKVVRIVYQSNHPENYNYRLPPSAEIYDVSVGCWRSICDSAPSYVVHNNSPSPVFVNGAVHWVASIYDDKSCTSLNLIAAFDMSEEVFREIDVPHSVEEVYVIKLSVMVLHDSLALVEYERIWQSDFCWIWSMKEYGLGESWSKLYSIDMRGGIRTVLGFGIDDEVFLSARILGVISYDSKRKKLKSVGIHGTNRSFYIGKFVESLVLLKQINGILDPDNASDSVINEETPLPGEEDTVDR